VSITATLALRDPVLPLRDRVELAGTGAGRCGWLHRLGVRENPVNEVAWQVQLRGAGFWVSHVDEMRPAGFTVRAASTRINRARSEP
jgi:hypothetical protein